VYIVDSNTPLVISLVVVVSETNNNSFKFVLLLKKIPCKVVVCRVWFIRSERIRWRMRLLTQTQMVMMIWSNHLESSRRLDIPQKVFL